MKITAKNLQVAFPKLPLKLARIIVRLTNRTIEPDQFEPAMKRINECYNRPSDTDLILTVVNSLLGGYGVESVPYYENAIRNGEFIEYVNFGDTYSTTVLYNPEKDRFEIGNWGSLYEVSPAYQAETEQDS